jgi:hypothetical protein
MNAFIAEAPEQDAPDASDYRDAAEYDAKERAWDAVKKKYPDLLHHDVDVTAWLFRDVWAAATAFAESWRSQQTAAPTERERE